MTLPSDQLAKPQLSAEERRARQADRFTAIRLRMAIWRKFEEHRITTPAEIAIAVGLPTDQAVRLMTRRRWREGTVAQLEAVATRLGLEVPVQ